MFNTATSHQVLQYPAKPMEGRANNIWKPSNGVTEIAPNCPRCASPNTKFCYYNNYSLSQPRYFCKGCRRYWTKGGSLRSVPVGGGCRKARRSRSSGKAERVRFDYSREPTNDDNDRRGVADIDMAEVFAKFLNYEDEQKGGADDSSSGASCGSTEVETDRTAARLESCDIPSDYLIMEGEQFRKEQMFGVEEYEEDNIIQDFMTSQHPNLVELHELLNDDELPGTMSPGFGWKNDLATFSYDVDQLTIAATTDDTVNWSSVLLDILPSGYGNYF